jgi:maltose O-acetyltransferase
MPELRSSTRKAVALGRALWVFNGRGVHVGPLPRVHGRVVVRCAGALEIGERLIVDGSPLPTKFSVGPDGALSIGPRAFVNFGVDINARESIVIGANVRIGPLVSIVDDDMHEVTPGQRRRSPIRIGDNVWLGRGVVVSPGVTIGDHAVVGANSVVTRDVAPATVVAGSPARLVRALEVPASWRRT